MSLVLQQIIIGHCGIQSTEVGHDILDQFLSRWEHLKNDLHLLRFVILTFDTATYMAVNSIKEIHMTMKQHDEVEQRDLLEKPAVMAQIPC